MLRRDYNISFCKDKYIFINILLMMMSAVVAIYRIRTHPSPCTANSCISKYKTIILQYIKPLRQNFTDFAETIPPQIMISFGNYFFCREVLPKNPNPAEILLKS